MSRSRNATGQINGWKTILNTRTIRYGDRLYGAHQHEHQARLHKRSDGPWPSAERRFGDVDAERSVDEFGFASVVLAELKCDVGEPLADLGCVDR